MNRIYIGDVKNVKLDSVVELCGWVQYVRDFGKVVFFVIKIGQALFSATQVHKVKNS